jgi:hypothetical protein
MQSPHRVQARLSTWTILHPRAPQVNPHDVPEGADLASVSRMGAAAG